MADVPSQLIDDPTPTYRGFRHQALYILTRILESNDEEEFQPEGSEDLAVYSRTGDLKEIVQVKSHTADLVPSSFGEPFYRRAASYVLEQPGIPIKVVSFGNIGTKLASAVVDKDYKERLRLAEYVGRFADNEAIAARIVDSLKVERVEEEEINRRLAAKISSLCTGIDQASAFDLLCWWIYRAAEDQTLLGRSDIIQKISSIGRFLAERSAFHNEWFTTIRPLECPSIDTDRRNVLAQEFLSGVGARFEHIALGLDVRRDTLISRIHHEFSDSSIVVVHGASGQGKSALAYRYCFDKYPEKWRYQVDLIEGDSHARKIALALIGHAQESSCQILVFIDVRPGSTAWVELAKSLADSQNIKVLVTLREEDWSRAFGLLAELRHASIELGLDQEEAERVYARLRSKDDIPHVLDFGDAWAKFGGRGPLLEFVYFLRHTATLEARLKSQITSLQDAERRGDIKSHELDLLRLASVATAYEARVDVQKLASSAGIKEPLRTIEAFEKEYFLRLTPDKKSIVALHPIRATILARLLTDDALSPWAEAASRVLAIIEEIDIERFLLCAFLRRPESRVELGKTLESFHPTSWTGLRSCVRALLWLGMREYIDENKEFIQEAFKERNEGWYIMLNFDIANISDFKISDLLNLSARGEAQVEAIRQLTARQTDPKRVFKRIEQFLHVRNIPVASPLSSADWRSLGEVCFWLGHLRVQCPAREWLSEDMLTAVLTESDIEALGEACAGAFALWGERYKQWCSLHHEELVRRMRTDLRIVSFVEEENAVDNVFLISRDEAELLGRASDAIDKPTLSLNDFTVSKLQIVRNILPFMGKYRSKGVGQTKTDVLPVHDESIKDISQENLLPRWGAELNRLFRLLATYDFRPSTWTDFSDNMLRARQEALDVFAKLRAGILAHYQSKENVDIIGQYLSIDGWYNLERNSYRTAFLPKCAADEWGLVSLDEEVSQLNQLDGKQRPAVGYRGAAQDYICSLSNFLLQAPPVLLRNAAIGKARRKSERRQVELQLRKVGIDGENQHLTVENLASLCKSLPSFHREIDQLLGEKINEDERKGLALREQSEMPELCLLWHEFLHRPGFVFDAAARQSQIQRLTELNIEQLLSTLRRRLQKGLRKISRNGIEFRVVDTDAGWDSKATLWIVCDAREPVRTIGISRILEKCIRETLFSCRHNAAHRFVVDFFWPQIVAVPLVAGKSLRRMAYPYLWGAVYDSKPSSGSEWRHIPMPISDYIWAQTGLEQWHSSRLLEFQGFADALAQLWEMCGYLANIFQEKMDVDDVGHDLIQGSIIECQGELEGLFQDVLDRFGIICSHSADIPDEELERRPVLAELFAFLEQLHRNLLPCDDWTGCGSMDQDDIILWYDRLTEAIGIAGVAELLCSADELGLDCDMDKLEACIVACQIE